MKSKILIVDDDEPTLHLLRRLLADENTKVICARNGTEALARAADDAPDLVLMDICMPHMNGYDVCKALRDDQRTRHLKIVMVSSLAEVQDQLHGLKCGADDYVTKPFDFGWLGLKVQKLLLKRQI